MNIASRAHSSRPSSNDFHLVLDAQVLGRQGTAASTEFRSAAPIADQRQCRRSPRWSKVR